MRRLTLSIVLCLCLGLTLAELGSMLTGNAQAQNLRSDNQKAAAKPAPFPLQLEMRVPFEPTAFPSGPHFYLLYEIHLTNFWPAPLSLSRIEVLDADAEGGPPIAAFEAEQLEGML